ELTRPQLPTPIARSSPWLVHSSLATQAEKVLSRNDRGICHRRQRGANQVPVHLAIVVDAQISARELVLPGDVALGPRTMTGTTSPPSDRRVVIVRACIDDDVWREVVRSEIRCLRIRTECKLEDRHPGKSQPPSQFVHLWRDDAEVFGDERQWRQVDRLLNGLEQRVARSALPYSLNRRLSVACRFPCRD